MRNDIKNFYLEKSGFHPYDFQLKVAEHLLNGQNVILSVPTGAGKTWASIIPFLYAKEHSEIHFPKKLIYNLPLRALANSIYEDVNNITDSSIQTGEFPDDKYFENDIIFSTIDQTLSNFLCFPLALSHRQANINAGALIGSYLIFDEFHLLDSGLSMATTLGMLRMLGNLCRCCIMTATLSKDFMVALKSTLDNYEILTLDEFEEDKKKIGSLKPTKDKKKVHVLQQTISSQKIIEEHKNKTIVLCNRVETAQKIYNGLVSKSNELTNTKIICLHSRFFNKDRKEKEQELKSLFGKDAEKTKSAILIATQVIEAGMDISCEVMHTEISPINSFLQRAGRCARFADEAGQIFVYDLLKVEEKEKIQIEPENEEDKEEIRKINNKYLPYNKELCESTSLALQKYRTLDNDIPKRLIELVLGEKEHEIIRQLEVANFNYQKILDSWLVCQKNHYRNTIRDIQNVEIVIINDSQCDEVTKYPYRFQSLGMYKWSLVGWLNKIVKGDKDTPPPKKLEEDDWLIKRLDEVEAVIIDNDEDVTLTLKEIPVDEFKSIPSRVFVNAKYFGYSPNFGFNWQYPDSFENTSPLKEQKEKAEETIAFKKDTFYQHNKALIGAFENGFLGRDNDKLDFIFKELGKFIGNISFQKSDFIKFITLMFILHDYGKLNRKWQLPMQYYQALKEGLSIKDFKEILGHTDYDLSNKEDEKFARIAKLYTRPSHAGVGAFVAQEIFPDMYDNDYLTSSISTAVARHHSPLLSNFPEFSISDSNYEAIQKLLAEFDLDIELEQEGGEDKLDGFEYDDWEKEQIIYLFFVRILRLCDQKATEDYQRYFKEKNYV